RLQRRAVGAIAGAGLLVTAAVLYGLHPDGWYLGTVPVWSWVSGVTGAAALLSAWLRR
ncbi:ubiquinone biosynthesis regulatory protein kinase UbiB, partial [Xanthomonas sp. Kuri4-2]